MKKLLIIIALTFCAYIPVLPAFAAIAQVAGAHATGFQGATTAAANFIGVNLIVISQVSYTGNPTSAVSDNLGNTYTPLTKQSGGAASATQLFYVVNPTVSSSMTFTPGNANADVHVVGFSGVATSPFDQQNGAVANGAITSIQPGSITPSQNNELLILGHGAWGGGNNVPSNGDAAYTLVDANGFISSVMFQGGLWYSIQTTAAASNPTISWSSSQNDSEAVAASFKAAAVAPSTPMSMIITFFDWW